MIIVYSNLSPMLSITLLVDLQDFMFPLQFHPHCVRSPECGVWFGSLSCCGFHDYCVKAAQI